MADFKVQRGTSTIPGAALSVTITAGTEYVAPSSASAAFIRVTSTTRTGQVDAGTIHVRLGVWPSNPENITTSVTFSRHESSLEAATFDWEIIEYVGAGGGANEFIVRGTDVISLADTAATGDSATISGVVTDADVVVFLTGQALNEETNGHADGALHTTEWVTASDVARVTRTGTNSASDASVAVVEFTGSNWSVERATHTYSAAGSTETETITSVGDLAKAMIHPQLRTGSPNLDEFGHTVWLSGLTELSFLLTSGADVSHDAVVWVISNSQSGGTTDMDVQRFNGSSTGTNPITETITSVTMAEAAIMGETASYTGTGSFTARAVVRVELTNATTVTLTLPDTNNTVTYRGEVVTWPEEGGGPGVTEQESVSEGLVLGEGIATVETVQFPDEGLLLGDSLSESVSARESLSEGLTLGDSVAEIVTTVAEESLSEGLSLGDSLSERVDVVEALSGSLALGEAISGRVDIGESLSDGLVLGEVVETSTDEVSEAIVSDGLILGELLEDQVSVLEALSDGLVLGDLVEGSAGESESLSEGLILGDSISDRVDVGESLSEGLVLGDLAEGVEAGTVQDSVGEGLVLGDLVGIQVSVMEALSEGLLLGDDLSAAGAVLESLSEGLLLGDALSSVVTEGGLPASDKFIYCATCGKKWRKNDDRGKYYFESPSFPIGSYASPKDIADAGENMTFCPVGHARGLSDIDRLTKDEDDRSFRRHDERAGKGDADVVHGGE